MNSKSDRPPRAAEGGRKPARRQAARQTKNAMLTVTGNEAGATLQNFLSERLKVSKRAAKDLIDRRCVWVNRQCVWMARHNLKGGDVVEAQVAAAEASAEKGRPRHVRILSQNEHYIFVDKPYGMLTIGPGGLEEVLREQIGDSELHAVHRLDRDTSGCLLVAKGKEALDAAISVFKTRRVKKLYEFVAAGRIETNPTTIATPIDGQPAKTTIRRISYTADATFGSARIETGRTHQIRIHLASIRHPVLGDRVHGLKKSPDPRLMRVPRQMLHATELELDDPMGRGHLRAHSPLPADFRRCLQIFGL